MAMLRTRHIVHGVFSVTSRDALQSGLRPGLQAAHDSGPIYTVPAGYRAILRDWQFLLSSAGVEVPMVIPYVFDGAVATWMTMWQEFRNQGGGVSMQTDVVMEPGWVLGLISDSDSCEYYISGALVTIPSS